jgi:hypothetical protein
MKRSEMRNRVPIYWDELTDFVGRSRLCRLKAEGNIPRIEKSTGLCA